MFKTIKIRPIEAGIVFRDGVFERLLGAGRHWMFDPWGKLKIERAQLRAPVAAIAMAPEAAPSPMAETMAP